jgi:hypothetical protein
MRLAHLVNALALARYTPLFFLSAQLENVGLASPDPSLGGRGKPDITVTNGPLLWRQ